MGGGNYPTISCIESPTWVNSSNASGDADNGEFNFFWKLAFVFLSCNLFFYRSVLSTICMDGGGGIEGPPQRPTFRWEGRGEW